MKSRTDWIINITFWVGGWLLIMVFFMVILAKVFLSADTVPKAPPRPPLNAQIITPMDAPLNGP